MRTMGAMLATAAVAASLVALSPAARADEGGVTSSLDTQSLDGSAILGATAMYGGINVQAVCESEYQRWEDALRVDHDTAIAAAEAEYAFKAAANAEAIDNGLEPPYPEVVGYTRPQWVRESLADQDMPRSLQNYVEQEWMPIDKMQTGIIDCFGEGHLPAPEDGYIGIRPPDDPPDDTDPCPGAGALPFSPAIWVWVPEWHDLRDFATDSGIARTYDLNDATFTIVVIGFVPLIGIQLPVDCLLIFEAGFASAHFGELLPEVQLDLAPAAAGLTGLDTRLWYDLSAPDERYITRSLSVTHRNMRIDLTAYAWIDEVGWDMDFDASSTEDAVWDEWVDFPDDVWSPAPAEAYEADGGSKDDPARTYIYETKDNYTIATGVTWRGFFVVNEIGGTTWDWSEPYEPITRWIASAYRVDEVVGRKTG